MATSDRLQIGDVVRVKSWRPARAAWFIILGADPELNKPVRLALAWTALETPPSYDDVPYLAAVDLSAFDGPELQPYMLDGLTPLSITVTGRDAWRPKSPHVRRWAAGVQRPMEAAFVGDDPYFFGHWDAVRAVANGPELDFGLQATEGRLRRHGHDVSTYLAAASEQADDRAARFEAANRAAGLDLSASPDD